MQSGHFNVRGAEALHTPQGRYWQTTVPGQPVLGCGHRPDAETRAFTRVNGQGDMPASMCIPCMEAYFRDFAARGTTTAIES